MSTIGMVWGSYGSLKVTGKNGAIRESAYEFLLAFILAWHQVH